MVVLNDNGMSSSAPNVGSLWPRYFGNRVRLNLEEACGTRAQASRAGSRACPAASARRSSGSGRT